MSSKDKRTKGQILKLLDKAMEQEERFVHKIKSLEAELADCRKKARDPRSELAEEALSGSKVSFRIDYYRTAENSPQKGIIEHLPTRQNKVFEGEGLEAIEMFIRRFLNEETAHPGKKKPAAEKKGGHKVAEEAMPVQTETIRQAAEEAPATGKSGSDIAAATPPPPLRQTPASKLLQRLRAEAAAEFRTLTGNPQAERPLTRTAAATSSAPETASLLKRVREMTKTPGPQVQKPVSPEATRPARPETEQTQSGASRTRLLERLRAEFRKSL